VVRQILSRQPPPLDTRAERPGFQRRLSVLKIPFRVFSSEAVADFKQEL
jgi:hypothetical protein